jgi:hypothetical protein
MIFWGRHFITLKKLEKFFSQKNRTMEKVFSSPSKFIHENVPDALQLNINSIFRIELITLAKKSSIFPELIINLLNIHI